jgi:hypothetical protein
VRIAIVPKRGIGDNCMGMEKRGHGTCADGNDCGLSISTGSNTWHDIQVVPS